MILKRGFTLAEVLITLTIIGVISSLTIPSIVNNVQETQFNAGIKKIYSTLSQALLLIQANNGGIVRVVSDVYGFRNDFCNVLGCIKQDTEANIFGSYTNYKFYKGINISTTLSWWADSYPAAVLNNGTFLFFYSYGDCLNWSA